MVVLLFAFGLLVTYLTNRYCQKNFNYHLTYATYIVIPAFFTGVNFIQNESISMATSIKFNFLLSVLILISFTDIKFNIIPNRLIILLMTLWPLLTVSEIAINNDQISCLLLNSACGAIFLGGNFLLAYIITKGGLGAGDVKLMFVIGLYLTFDRAIQTMIYALLLAAIYGIAKIIITRKSKDSKIPFAPFALLGSVLSIIIVY